MRRMGSLEDTIGQVEKNCQAARRDRIIHHREGLYPLPACERPPNDEPDTSFSAVWACWRNLLTYYPYRAKLSLTASERRRPMRKR